MFMIRIWLGAAICVGLCPVSALACTLVLGSGGVLDLSTDGTILSSTEGLGQAASLEVVTGLFDEITISAPALVQAPAAYVDAGDARKVAYRGFGLLAFIDQPFTGSDTSFTPGLLPLSLLTLDASLTTATGFAPGNYSLRVQVTCS